LKLEFTDLKKSGTFKYEESSNKLIFSGFMQGAEGIYKIQNGTAILLISSKAQDGSINTIQFEKKLATLQVDLTNPNGIFDGKIVLSATSSTTDHFDLKIAKITKTFISNTTAVTNESNLHIFTYLDNPFDASEDYGHVVISDEKGKELRRFRGKSNQYKKWIIGDYWYVSLSPDGTKFALTGYYLEHSFVFDPNYVKPYPIVSIFDFDGNELRSFRTSKDFGWGAAWLPNGGLIFADEKGGINITDKDFKQVSKIYNQDVLEARCSPDGKIVAFAKGGQIFTINIDGSNEKKLINKTGELSYGTNQLADLAWSPDSKKIAISIKNAQFNHYNILLTSLDGNSFSYLNDPKGEQFKIIKPFISWIK
jgi:hypothetical protein